METQTIEQVAAERDEARAVARALLTELTAAGANNEAAKKAAEEAPQKVAWLK